MKICNLLLRFIEAEWSPRARASDILLLFASCYCDHTAVPDGCLSRQVAYRVPNGLCKEAVCQKLQFFGADLGSRRIRKVSSGGKRPGKSWMAGASRWMGLGMICGVRVH